MSKIEHKITSSEATRNPYVITKQHKTAHAFLKLQLEQSRETFRILSEDEENNVLAMEHGGKYMKDASRVEALEDLKFKATKAFIYINAYLDVLENKVFDPYCAPEDIICDGNIEDLPSQKTAIDEDAKKEKSRPSTFRINYKCAGGKLYGKTCKTNDLYSTLSKTENTLEFFEQLIRELGETRKLKAVRFSPVHLKTGEALKDQFFYSNSVIPQIVFFGGDYCPLRSFFTFHFFNKYK
jgi:hypothetical protein